MKLPYIIIFLMSSSLSALASIVQAELANGFKVIVQKTEGLQKVSVRLVVHVGSLDEQQNEHGERGMAHLLEHMFFKGTATYPEGYLDKFAKTLSGYTNAYTTYDHTAYQFDLPVTSWKRIIPIYADYFANLTISEDMLNSELGAVTEEFKMGRDNSSRQLFFAGMKALFPENNYQYPIIGFREDLWHMHAEQLKRFYKKYYVPNNAFLLVVGNVDPHQVIREVERYFGTLPASPLHKHVPQDACTVHPEPPLKVYRDVAHPQIVLFWHVTPQQSPAAIVYQDAVETYLNNMTTSPFYKRLVEDEKLALSCNFSVSSLGATSHIATLHCTLKNIEDTSQVLEIIRQEIEKIAQEGIAPELLKNMYIQNNASLQDLAEDNAGLARYLVHAIVYFGTSSLYHELRAVHLDPQAAQFLSKNFVRDQLAFERAQIGTIEMWSDSHKSEWIAQQYEYDTEDQLFLASRKRENLPPDLAGIEIAPDQENHDITYPRPDTIMLRNEVRVLMQHMPGVERAKIAIDLETPSSFKRYKSFFMDALLRGGTKNRSFEIWLQELHSLGARYTDDFQIVFPVTHISAVMQLVYELVTFPAFDEKKIELLRQEFIAQEKNAAYDAQNLALESFGQGVSGQAHDRLTIEDIEKCTTSFLMDHHRKMVIPKNITIFMVGDFDDRQAVTSLLNNTFGLLAPQFKQLSHLTLHTTHMDRDQAIIMMGGPSIAPRSPQIDALLMYLIHLNDRLFKLREETGLFYGIQGSTKENSAGMLHWFIQAEVSPFTIPEIYDRLINFIKEDIERFNQHDLELAQQHYLVGIAHQAYATSQDTIDTIYQLTKSALPHAYYTQRVERLKSVTLEEIRHTVRSILSAKNMHISIVGRIGNPDMCQMKQASFFEEQEFERTCPDLSVFVQI